VHSRRSTRIDGLPGMVRVIIDDRQLDPGGAAPFDEPLESRGESGTEHDDA
jgi:hypothetical protein